MYKGGQFFKKIITEKVPIFYIVDGHTMLCIKNNKIIIVSTYM